MNFSKWTKVENLPSAIAGENWLKMLGNCRVGDWNFRTSEYFGLFAIFGNIPWIFWILRKYSNRTLFDRPHWPAFRGELSGGGFGKLETIEGREGLGLGAPWALRWARSSSKDWVDELADEQLNLGEFPANESRPVSQTGGISEFPAILFIFETEGKDVGSIIFSLVIFELGLGFSFF